MVELPDRRPTEAASTNPVELPSTTSGWERDSVRTIGRGSFTVYDTRGDVHPWFAGRANAASSRLAMGDTLGTGVPYDTGSERPGGVTAKPRASCCGFGVSYRSYAWSYWTRTSPALISAAIGASAFQSWVPS